MKKILVFLLCFVAVSAHAFEFNLKGSYENNYYYLSRFGSFDLFGNVNVLNAAGLTSIGFAGPNSGIVAVEGFSSKGADASYNLEKLIFYPELKLNSAVSLRGIVSFQSNLNGLYSGGSNWANPQHFIGYMPANRTEEYGNVVTSAGLKALWARMEFPIGTLEVGRRPLIFGTGWAGFHVEDTTTQNIGLTLPYGPLTFYVGHNWSVSGDYNSPYDSRNVNQTPYTIQGPFDRNKIPKWDSVYSITWQQGNVDFGVLSKNVYYHNVHGIPNGLGTYRDDVTASFMRTFYNAARTRAADTDPLIPIYGDGFLSTNVIYLKYFNGRFFFNGEYDQEYLSIKRQGGRPISGYPKGWFLEAGLLWGPGKLSLANFYRSGHDRQGGLLDVRAPEGQFGTIQSADRWNQYIVLGGASKTIDNYQWLLGLYGTGNNSYDPSGNPTYLDFVSYAARIDYAMAANLNLFATYMYARRASNTGTWQGQYTGGIDQTPLFVSNVPDNNLGQEIGAGINWKLLENVSWNLQCNYWKVGNWFKYAYADYSMPINNNDQNTGAVIRVNPNRDISPIFGLKTGVTLEF